MTTKNQKQLPAVVPDKLQPHNVEAEEAVIGSLLIDPDAIIRVATFLNGPDFFIERHGMVFDAIQALSARNQPADLVTLADELERRGELREVGGGAYLTSLINQTPTSIHVEYYGRIVERCAVLRRLINAAGQISRLAYRDQEADAMEVVNRAEEIIFNVSPGGDKHGLQHVSVAVQELLDQVNYLQNHKGQVVGLPTGLTDLDKLIGGLQRSDMVVVAGRPGMGKSSLSLNVAHHATRKLNKRVAIFSLEMSKVQLVQRLVSAETGIDSFRIRVGDIRGNEWPTFIAASKIIHDAPIFIDDTPAISAMELRAKARRLHAEYGLDLLIVDYLQLMTGDRKSENRQQEISYISRSIKALARELNIPILALSQLSRECEKRHDKRPHLSDLRDSGSIEQDSDVVIFIYRDDVYNPDTEFPDLAELIVGKHRGGPTGMFSVYFRKPLCQFVDLEIHHQQLEPAPGTPAANGNGRGPAGPAVTGNGTIVREKRL